MGMPTTVTSSMGQVWDQTVHHIKTIYGTSVSTYSSTPNFPLFGPGQGCTCGPIFWLLCFCLIVDSFDPDLATAVFASATMEVVVQTLGTAFVDDSSLSVTSNYQHDNALDMASNMSLENSKTIRSLNTIAQHWERLLFSTGGAINMQKSFWYLLAWVWKNGTPKLVTTKSAPGEMELTSGSSTTLTTVPRLEVTDSFRTLGVYISPSGSQLKQTKILRQNSEQYYIHVNSSTLSPDEAYTSYMQYLRPKIIYPLPCSSLTQKQCQYVQAPALAALIPKLHVNRHIAHVIIFGAHRYGGLSLPDLYTDQGYGQLKLLIGHIKLGDDIGKLILIAMSHLQLHIGSEFPFFTCSYPPYAKWIDQNWLASIWKHMHQLQIKVEVENHWTPRRARQNDVLLMDEFMKYNLTPSQLRMINYCRLYLQVLLLSDIATADGRFILPSIFQGSRAAHRTSSLHWPRQTAPPASAWNIWRLALGYIATNRKLNTKLGSWITFPHQKWEWFTDMSSETVYLQKNNTWTAYQPVASPLESTRTTRQTKLWYNKTSCQQSDPVVLSIVPTTVYIDKRDPNFFHTDHSPNPIPVTTPRTPNTTVWVLPPHDHAFVDTPEFYQRIIGLEPPVDRDVGFQIATGIELETLITCSDGSFDPQTKKGSHGWVLSNTDRVTLAQGSGPADGHPTLMSSYRAELGGLIAILYTIYRICQFHQVSSGKFNYYCDNKGVLTNVFSNKPTTITQFLHADYDLVYVAKQLVTLIPATIVANWVKGHYTGEYREHKHDLNEQADKLATKFNACPPTVLKQVRMPCTVPGYAIRLVYDGSTITNKLHKTMSQALHGPKFVSHLKQKNDWNDSTFQRIHWDAHERAFTSHTRNNQIMIAKIIHKLVNTNYQNHKFFENHHFARAVRPQSKQCNTFYLAPPQDQQKPEKVPSLLCKQI